MVAILLPNLSTTFLAAAIIPLLIGFVVGYIVRNALKVGIALLVLVILLIAAGIITPNQVITPLAALVKSGATASTVSAYANRIAGYLPYSSLTFIIGLAVGLLKG
ncbi:MAG: hypothetical protein JRM85_01070 [Nitrososphaerota archaeon]|jgi:uncharacterized membrane protein (Fun14 family)|nr:hypothetical protein [Nitrososphaerota archaeon]MDG6919736.1 hypothetical protein [Nitrososphaerota archaeon]MDG6946067.1 hypothetical protein [Nitrososphaerota archaeon]